MFKQTTYGLLLLSIIALNGCVSTSDLYDYTAFNNHKPRSILVIPPQNNSIDPNAPYTYLSTITQPLAEKGYYVFPVAVIDQFLKENGLPTPAEMNAIPLDRIGAHVGADAVLYITLTDWGQQYEVISSKTIVEGHVKLVDVKTGITLWDAPIHAVKASDSGGNGLIGALVNAAVTQILGDLQDHTPALARQANSIAINSSKRGLPNGPYLPEKTEK
jgi:hypothetical protein